MNLNIEIKNEETFKRFKEVAAERGQILLSAVPEAMELYIHKNSARTRMEQRISYIVQKLPGPGQISEKGLHNLLNTYEWVSMKTVQEIISEMIIRKLVVSHKVNGVTMLTFEAVQ